MKPFVLLTVLLVSAASLAATYIYRWTDDAGQVHYSETPPRDRAYETLRSDKAGVTDDSIRASDEDEGDGASAPRARAAAPEPSPEDANREFLKKAEAENKAAAEAKAKQEKEKAALDARCKQARERMTFLDTYTSHRLATVDDAGEVSRYTEQDWERERATAQKAIAESCR